MTKKWKSIRYGYEKYSIQDENGSEIGFVHRVRDADLIAAAPDLYIALNKIVNGMFIGESGANYLDEAQDALQKAEGF